MRVMECSHHIKYIYLFNYFNWIYTYGNIGNNNVTNAYPTQDGIVIERLWREYKYIIDNEQAEFDSFMLIQI